MLRLTRFSKDTTGAVAVEFAVVAVVLLAVLVFVLVIALAFFFKQSLDVATSVAARQVLTGAAQRGNMDQTQFKQVLCSRLWPMMSCSDVIVNLYTVPEGQTPSGYYSFVNSDRSGLTVPSAAGAGSYDLGRRGAYQYLEVIYPFTLLPGLIQSATGTTFTYNGKPAYALISTAAFRNEQY